MRRTTILLATVLLASGCIWTKELQITFDRIKVANKNGDEKAVDAWVEVGQAIVGKPKADTPMPPATIEGAKYYLGVIRQKQARIMAFATGILRALGIPGCASILGTLSLAGIAGWLFKNKSSLTRVAGNLSALAMSKGATVDDVKEVQKEEGQRDALKADYAKRSAELDKRKANGGKA